MCVSVTDIQKTLVFVLDSNAHYRSSTVMAYMLLHAAIKYSIKYYIYT